MKKNVSLPLAFIALLALALVMTGFFPSQTDQQERASLPRQVLKGDQLPGTHPQSLFDFESQM